MKDPMAAHALRLERYRLSELPPAEIQELRTALNTMPELRDRLQALDASDREILATRPPALIAARVEQRAREAGAGAVLPSGSLRLAPALVLGLALAVAASLVQRGALPGGAPASDRAKGGAPSLLLFRQGPNQTVERLDPGALARAHDVLQLAYQAGGRRYGVIVSIDGRGVVTRHFPAAGDDAGVLEGQGLALLRTAYRLDDAPRLERFYLVAADAPFAFATVEAAARRAAVSTSAPERLPLDASFAQASFELRKE
jgi:hypothetical protein